MTVGWFLLGVLVGVVFVTVMFVVFQPRGASNEGYAPHHKAGAGDGTSYGGQPD